MDLKPRAEHFDRRITVTTPLQEAGGAYLVDGEDGGRQRQPDRRLGRRHRLVKKQLDGRSLLLRRRRHHRPAGRQGQRRVLRLRSSRLGDDNQYRDRHRRIRRSRPTPTASSCSTQRDRAANEFQWLITAHRRPDGRARLPRLHRHLVPASTTTTRNTTRPRSSRITDRPVYRPSQTVKFKIWVGQAQVRPARASRRLRRPVVHRQHPQSARARRSSRRASPPTSTAASTASSRCRKDATLGSTTIQLVNGRAARRRRQLPRRGVQEARVRGEGRRPDRAGHARREDHRHDQGQVLLRRAGHQGQGEVQGHCARSYSADWYPAGRVGLVLRPRLLVVRRRLPLVSRLARVGLPPADADLVVRPQPRAAGGRRRERGRRSAPTARSKVEIDTPLAKELHGDQDHKYAITAEVTDESRRTIVGSGNVLVARKPFKVYAWVDRGHYRAGDTIEADFSAQTLDHKPVEGKGELKLLQDQLRRRQQAGREGGADVEARHRRRRARPRQQIKAAEPGQYRLSYKRDRRQGARDRRRLRLRRPRRGLRRQGLPLQRPRADHRQAGIRARRQGQAA